MLYNNATCATSATEMICRVFRTVVHGFAGVAQVNADFQHVVGVEAMTRDLLAVFPIPPVTLAVLSEATMKVSVLGTIFRLLRNARPTRWGCSGCVLCFSCALPSVV